jgi:hypothetical protein
MDVAVDCQVFSILDSPSAVDIADSKLSRGPDIALSRIDVNATTVLASKYPRGING